MTAFENFLISKGYLKFILDGRKMAYEQTEKHRVSSLANLNHRYFHKEDPAIEKIKKGFSIMSSVFTPNDRSGEIIFGLREKGKPATLISPRPNIKKERKPNTDSVEIIDGVKTRVIEVHSKLDQT
jgi:hypothetical protein